ncbi:MAG: AmmeMemoRadiSam system protein B [Deltaproteobacteria bacterium]|nr:AmmeMemoRadiSam system protein B [Deltaproteobacteria bacterium]
MSSWYRPTAVAGTFYPKEKEALSSMIEEWLEVGKVIPQKVTAIVAPHAGYLYSGKFAAQAYKRIHIPDRIYLLCPNHSGFGNQIAVWSEGEWETPLGTLSVDQQSAQDFLSNCGQRKGDRDAHIYEHAIEVHLPFIHTLNPAAKIIPICLGPLSLETCVSLGKALARTVQASKVETLLIASTDMSHYIHADEARKKDSLALAAIEKVDATKLYETVAHNDVSMCGFVPTTCVLEAAKLLAAKSGQIVAYGNSGEVTGDMKSVVAYAAALIQ